MSSVFIVEVCVMYEPSCGMYAFSTESEAVAFAEELYAKNPKRQPGKYLEVYELGVDTGSHYTKPIKTIGV